MGASYAVFPDYLRIRRVSQICVTSEPGGVGRAGDVLLASLARLRSCIFSTTTRRHLSLHHATLLLFPYSNNLRSIYHFHRLNGLAGDTTPGSATIVWLCYVIIKDWGSRKAALTSVILASFFFYNDYACSSNNKWLCRTMPMR